MTKTAEIVERLRDAVRGIRFAEGHHLVLNKMQAEMLCTPAAEAADHLEALEARLEKARAGLRYYACEDGPSVQGDNPKDWFLCHKTDREPVETLYDLGHRARRTLSEIEDGT